MRSSSPTAAAPAAWEGAPLAERGAVGGGGGVFRGLDGALQVFPAAFTLFNVAVFLAPVWVASHAGRDRHVMHWVPGHTWAVVFLVVLWPLAHILQAVRGGAPGKFVVVTCLVAQCVTLLLVGQYVMITSYKVGNSLMAEGCRAFLPKLQLENDFVQAKSFYSECMSETIRTSNMTSAQAMEQFRIQDCTTYESVAARHPGWSYLRYLEETYHCAGWCTEDVPLWTGVLTQDACSPVVAEHLLNNVQVSMEQVLVYAAFVLIAMSVVLLRFDPALRSHGLRWGAVVGKA